MTCSSLSGVLHCHNTPLSYFRCTILVVYLGFEKIGTFSFKHWIVNRFEKEFEDKTGTETVFKLLDLHECGLQCMKFLK